VWWKVKNWGRFVLETLFNAYGTHIPSRRVRRAWLRVLGARIGPGSAVFRGTTVFGAHNLQIGERTNVGWRCVLDARGGITIGDDIVVSSDCQLITGDHLIDDPGFAAYFLPIIIDDHAWIATRSLVIRGVRVGRGAVVAAGAVVTRDVTPLQVVTGSPARPLRMRQSALGYRLGHDPWLY
jgi:acetyltransferase-like isoleucine patch superfamily enzyme